MFRRLYTSAALFVLPAVDDILDGIQRQLVRLDKLTQAIERDLENRVVALAEISRDRRRAIEAVNRVADIAEAKQMNVITARQDKLNRAADARDRVADFLAAR